mgnify:CR=1 FL=1
MIIYCLESESYILYPKPPEVTCTAPISNTADANIYHFSWISCRLQKFKLNIANTIVNQENSGLTSMATDQLLDLFSVDAHGDLPTGAQPSKGLKAMLQDMTELWDESDYDTEYNVENFLATLAKQ